MWVSVYNTNGGQNYTLDPTNAYSIPHNLLFSYSPICFSHNL